MNKLGLWLSTTPYKDYDIAVASADASFRKYYRLSQDSQTYLLMDSSQELDSLIPFIRITKKLLSVQVNVPKILEQNIEEGFLILEDFGSTHYLDVLNEDNFEDLYKKAINVIIQMQESDASDLARYDKDFLIYEMNLMQEWYMGKLLPSSLSEEQEEIIQTSLDSIAEVILTQPQDIFVHRDFHSRNIMLKSDDSLGIIDYQDAMSGSLLYELASLLEDSYIEFDKEKVQKLVLYFRDKKGLDVDDALFLKWFDFVSMQRHIKVLGIFARLFKRDAKEGYLKDLPLTLKYLFDTTKLYDETKALHQILKEL